MTKPDNIPMQNTDKEIWRERKDDYYADSIHVTESGGIGINCGGTVIVLPVREWHKLANARFTRQTQDNLIKSLVSDQDGGFIVMEKE